MEQRGIAEAGIEPALDADIIPFDLAMPDDASLALDMAFPIDATAPADAPPADAPPTDAPLNDAPDDGGLVDGGLTDGGVDDASTSDDGGVGDGGTGVGDGGFPSRDALDPQLREMESFYACGECSTGGDPLTALGPGLVVLGLVLRRRRPAPPERSARA